MKGEPMAIGAILLTIPVSLLGTYWLAETFDFGLFQSLAAYSIIGMLTFLLILLVNGFLRD